jgi:hypothetical protein
MSLGMSRNVAALAAVFVVGLLLWLVMAWHAPTDEPPVALQLEEAPEPAPQPSAAKSPEPSLAPPPVANAPAPAPPAEADTEPTAPKAPPIRQVPELIKGDQGPVAEYRAQYESESRGSASSGLESKLRAAFPDADGAPDLVRSIACRETICKLELRWSNARLRGWVLGVNRFQDGFVLPFALSPIGEKDGDGVRRVEVFLKRKPPGPPPKLPDLHAH